jgi:hypothetical protein
MYLVSHVYKGGGGGIVVFVLKRNYTHICSNIYTHINVKKDVLYIYVTYHTNATGGMSSKKIDLAYFFFRLNIPARIPFTRAMI